MTNDQIWFAVAAIAFVVALVALVMFLNASLSLRQFRTDIILQYLYKKEYATAEAIMFHLQREIKKDVSCGLVEAYLKILERGNHVEYSTSLSVYRLTPNRRDWMKLSEGKWIKS